MSAIEYTHGNTEHGTSDAEALALGDMDSERDRVRRGRGHEKSISTLETE